MAIRKPKVGKSRLRCPRPRTSGRNSWSPMRDYTPCCAAERGADGASAPSLPSRKSRVTREFHSFRLVASSKIPSKSWKSRAARGLL